MWARRLLGFAVALLLIMQGCGGVIGPAEKVDAPTPPPPPPDTQNQLQGVFRWKGSDSGNGLYSAGTLTPQTVSSSAFGLLARYHTVGDIQAQPLYVSNLDMGSAGVHNVLIVATEHDDIAAFDADGKVSAALWQRSYLGPGITTGTAIFGGRTGLGPEVGITGTPVIDPASGAMYFVTLIVENGAIEQWVRAVDIRTGMDFGPGGVMVQATLPGDGPGSNNGQISFDPSVQNQRCGLALVNGQVLIAWGSFSDSGVYRGWLMAYDGNTLKQTAVFSPATQYQSQDAANGQADHGGGGAFWAAGAAPSIDSAGNIYLIAADGSFNASTGGQNYGDSVLKLKLSNGSFQVLDYYTPANNACLDHADLEIGSGGLMLLPSGAAGSQPLAITGNKEGRLYLLDTSNLGKFDAADAQIPQQFLVGSQACQPGQAAAGADGPGWERLYGNATYWNGSVYLAPANTDLRQYRFSGGTLSTTPASRSVTQFLNRGANTVVSANRNADAIVWAETKDAKSAISLHAYDANDVSHELWNNYKGTNVLYPGVRFATPVVVDNKVIAAGKNDVFIYGLVH
ncbi:MAG TPA: hypothetical protein VJS37_07490 [Terriglobales bacterium]|nr:hypothetical protein [Terriglobales bacterium]